MSSQKFVYIIMKLYQAALGYLLFLYHGFTQLTVTKLLPFLNQFSAFSSPGQMTDDLRKFLVRALGRSLEGNNSKLSVGITEPKLGAHIFEIAKLPCQTNEFVLELFHGVQLHVGRIINPTMEPLFTLLSKSIKFSSSTPDWSNLPTDILVSVVIRLSCFDIIRFKHVCRSWRIAVSNTCVISRPPTQPPLLMLSTADKRGCFFFNIVDQKIHRAFNNFWGDLDIFCIGCSKGWLILHVVHEGSQSSSVFIFNPFRLEARKIVIPSNPPSQFEISRTSYRTLLTSDPNHCGGKFGVVFRTGCHVTLLMQDSYQSENSKWIEFPLLYCFDITCTRDCIFVLDFNGSLVICMLASTTRGLLRVSSKKIIRVPVHNFDYEVLGPRPWSPETLEDGSSLVESEGDIFLVRRSVDTRRENGMRVNTTSYFKVLKFSYDKKQWLNVESLGDRALFLGGNQSLCFSVLDIQGCERNCIYFTDHVSAFDNKMGGDVGVFSLKDGRIKKLIRSESKRINQRGIWLV